MIGTSYSNYVNSLSNLYKYNYNDMAGKISGANNVPVNYGSSKTNYFNSDAISYLTSIQNNAKVLSANLKAVTDSSTFNKMTAVSSNNDYLSVTGTPTKNFEPVTVEIDKLASGQSNKGQAMQSADLFGGSVGYQQFEIEVDGKKQQFSINVSLGDDNKAVQQKMASAINKKNIGVTATVSTDSTGKNTTLSLQSAGTGDDAKNRFTVRDVSGTLAQTFGITEVSQEAQDAVYRVNGGDAQTAKSNTVDLGNGVKATLKDTTTEPVTVSAREDNGYAVDKVKELADSFNKLMSSTNGNDRLSRELNEAYKTYALSLEKLGITMDKEGKLSVDSEALGKAAENGTLESYFIKNNSQSYGFAARLSSIAGNISNNPTRYVNRESASEAQDTDFNSIFDTYASLSDNTYSGYINNSNFNLRTYNQYLTLGYLFDLFV